MFYFFDAIMTLIISIAIMTLIITVEWKSGEGSIIGKKHALEKCDQFFILGKHFTNFLLKKELNIIFLLLLEHKFGKIS